MDWIAGCLEILGKYIVGRKCRWGWIIHLVAGVLWFYIACKLKVYGLFIIVIPAFFLNIYNFIIWSKNGKDTNKL